MKKLVLSTLGALILSVLPGLLPVDGLNAAQAAVVPDKIVKLAMGSTSSSSGIYAHSVALGSVINKYAGGVMVTVVESGGGYDNLRRMQQGVFGLADATGWNASMEMFVGTGTFTGKAWKQVRLMALREVTYIRIYVNEEIAKKRNIKVFSDLSGQKFHVGQAGSASATWLPYCNQALGLAINLTFGSLSDGTGAVQEGRLTGIAKSSPLNSFDASMKEVHFTTPVTVIGFTAEDVAKIRALHPILLFAETPAGAIKDAPSLRSIYEMISPSGFVASSLLPEDIAYRIVKAVCEHHEDIVNAYPSSKGVHPIADYFKVVPAGKPEEVVPFHAGVIRYAKELGIKVPVELIPPEYSGPR